MSVFSLVNPERFIDHATHQPRYGRGCWNRHGKANGSWRYEWIETLPKIGTNAEQSLDAWATCAGCYAYQSLLIRGGYLRELEPPERGIFGPATKGAVQDMQRNNKNPANGRALTVDGTIGRADAAALLTPVIDQAEARQRIPNHLLRGETALESGYLDCGALGSYIWYGDELEYRGVDRSVSQINSHSNEQVTWEQAFNPVFSINWSAERMRNYYDQFRRAYPDQTNVVLWDAALCAHNSPLNAWSWARRGAPPNDVAAKYVSACKAARY